MIEQKLVVGRYLELNTGEPAVSTLANGFQSLNRVVLHIEESHRVAAPLPPAPNFPGLSTTQQIKVDLQRAGQEIKSQLDRQRVSATGLGAVAKTHRNFLWLEWMPGVVSEVQQGGVDVLTGPMSGCWIVTYMRGGQRCVGHIGTFMDSTTAQSIAARKAWNDFVATVPRDSYSGFNPFNDPWKDAVPAAENGEGLRKTFALVTAAGGFYTIITYPQLNKPSRIRIAGIQQNKDSLPGDGRV